MTAGDTQIWVHGNATEHLAEYATAMTRRGVDGDMVNLATQQQLRGLQAAVESATAHGIPFNQLIVVGGWELKFSQRATDRLPVLMHAL